MTIRGARGRPLSLLFANIRVIRRLSSRFGKGRTGSAIAFSVQRGSFLFFFVQSDRLQKVFIYVDEVHGLCAVLGMDFAETVKEVHPSLHGTNSENSTNISDSTLEGLTQTILKLKAEKKTRLMKVIT